MSPVLPILLGEKSVRCLPFSIALIILAVSSSLSQKYSGERYPLIINGFCFILHILCYIFYVTQDMEDLFYFKKSFRSCPNVSHFAPAIRSAPDVLPPCPPSLRSGQALSATQRGAISLPLLLLAREGGRGVEFMHFQYILVFLLLIHDSQKNIYDIN